MTCGGSDDPRNRCGRHHPTELACGGGYSCCCGEPWVRKGCATDAQSGDPVPRQAQVRALIAYAALAGDPAEADSLAASVLALFSDEGA